VSSKSADYEFAVDTKAKKRSKSGDRDNLRQKSSGKNDTLPTMESNHKYRDGDGKRYTAKKEGHRLAEDEQGPLSRCLFVIRSFFMVTRRPLGKGRICEAIVVAIGRVRAYRNCFETYYQSSANFIFSLLPSRPALPFRSACCYAIGSTQIMVVESTSTNFDK